MRPLSPGHMPQLDGLPPNAFAKEDPEDDATFYAAPRFETHIDDEAIAALTAFYRRALPPGGVVLDLMSSWISHLPPDVAYGEVIGHGMNAEELAANRQLSRWFLQDLNREPVLPLADASVDAAVICVGIQYLQSPVAVLADLRRVIRPGGLVAISFSNRCFPTKAVQLWLSLDDDDHARLVGLYLDEAGFGEITAERLRPGGWNSDPMIVVTGRA
ncbi:class I SAM-dependent methyltransferase [Caulobacter sp. KR2-114]|uniref:class I SAM-dependent methyltransferase n=1 Tax=Caulobacter sp. KR2-114 TaxID=3400912 RepID=UPI003C047F74